MDKVFQERLLAVAEDVRQWAEDRAPLGKEDDLNGMCAIASAELHRRLKKEGIASEIHMWLWDLDESAHVYVVVDDHVLDVTATQFKQFRTVPVVLMHCKEAEAYDFYQSKQIFKCADSLRKQQRRDRWPTTQVALPY